MADIQDYEAVSVYPLDPDMQEKLLSTHNECVFNWGTKDGWAMGVIMSYLWHDGRVWLTAGAHRHRISAIRRDPRCSVVITSNGTKLGPGKSITIKGRAVVHEDRETKDWFYPAFSSHLNSEDPKAAARFQEHLDSPIRVVVEVVPEKFITYDGVKMFMDEAGKLPQSAKGAPKSADAERLPRELSKRGLDG
jgi:general stress protein 26